MNVEKMMADKKLQADINNLLGEYMKEILETYEYMASILDSFKDERVLEYIQDNILDEAIDYSRIYTTYMKYKTGRL